jgi:hypothetical protein
MRRLRELREIENGPPDGYDGALPAACNGRRRSPAAAGLRFLMNGHPGSHPCDPAGCLSAACYRRTRPIEPADVAAVSAALRRHYPDRPYVHEYRPR